MAEPTERTCLTCRLNRGELPAPGGVIYQDAWWQLQHSVEPVPLLGWLVLKPLRHVEAFADLTDAEAATFGPLTRRITLAMMAVLHPAKIYLSVYAEAEGFAHLHVHLIPRSAQTSPERRGPRIFEYLGRAQRPGKIRSVAPRSSRPSKIFDRFFTLTAMGRYQRPSTDCL